MFVSDAALAFLRTRVEAEMVDTVDIHRSDDATPVFNPTSGSYDIGASTLIHSGKARLTPSTGPKNMQVGDEAVIYRDTVVYLPFSAPVPQVNDLITVTSSRDSDLVGRVLRVTDVMVGTNRVSRKVACTSQEPQS